MKKKSVLERNSTRFLGSLLGYLVFGAVPASPGIDVWVFPESSVAFLCFADL